MQLTPIILKLEKNIKIVGVIFFYISQRNHLKKHQLGLDIWIEQKSSKNGKKYVKAQILLLVKIEEIHPNKEVC